MKELLALSNGIWIQEMDKEIIDFPLASTTWDKREYEAIDRVVKSRNFTMGQEVKEFESDFAKFVGSNHAVMFNSGSSANLALLAAVKYMKKSPIPEGSTILVPAVSWSTTYYPINQLGYKLKFVDIDPQTLNISIEHLRNAISPETKAIFVVNLLGNPAPFKEIIEIAVENQLVILEDNCESLGATYEGKQAGTFGLGGTFSSFFSHHISTMEGGIVVTNSEVLDHTLRSIRAHGWTRDLPDINHVFEKTGDKWEDLFRFVLPGYNFRPLELEGAIGQAQIQKLPDLIKVRRKNAVLFQSLMAKFRNFRIQEEIGQSSWFGFALVLQNQMEGKRKLVVDTLSSLGIESRPIVAGNFTRNPVMKHLNYAPLDDLSGADYIHENGLFVGNHHYDLSREIQLLAGVLERFEVDNG